MLGLSTLKAVRRIKTVEAAPLKLVAAGKTDLAISYEPEVMRARDKGARVVSIAALVQEPLTSIISLPKARILSPVDLRAVRVACLVLSP